MARWSFIPTHYIICAMAETRWFLIPTAPTLHTLCPRHSGLSFPPPLPYICYAWDTMVSHSNSPYLTFAMVETRWSLIPIHPTLHSLCSKHGGLSFQPPLPYIRYSKDAVASHSNRPDLIYAMSETRQLSFPLPNLTHDMPETQWALISTALPYLCYVRDTVVTHSHRPFLIYALSETQWSLIPTAPILYLLFPRHGYHS